MDQNHEPVPGVILRFGYEDPAGGGNPSPLRPDEESVTTSEEGEWEVTWIPEEVQQLTINAEHPGFTRATAAVKSGGRAWVKLAAGEAIMRIHRKF